MELRAGFPYTMAHACAVANQVVKLLFPPSPMKGLITDLDETFWSGIVGEVGVRNVSWSLAEHTPIHGLYQQMLGHLSEMGVLLAIASKNEIVRSRKKHCEREDLLVPARSFFPVCANWGPKSDKHRRDSAGLEYRSRERRIRGRQCDGNRRGPDDIPVNDLPAVLKEAPGERRWSCSEQLRDLFGKPVVQREDALRQDSIRANVALQTAAGGSPGSEFLRGLQGRLTFDCRKDPSNKRLLELINKTNQFNLNGVRLSEGEWIKHLEDQNVLVASVSYEDKFGPLGTIGVLSGRQVNDELELTSWVLSCRAFSRKIEDHMLDHLFNQHKVAVVRLAFRPTVRNQPLRSYLAALGTGCRCRHSARCSGRAVSESDRGIAAPGAAADIMTTIPSRVSQCFLNVFPESPPPTCRAPARLISRSGTP